MADISLTRSAPIAIPAAPRAGKLGRRLAMYAVLVTGAFAAAFPFIWMFLTAVKPRQEAVRNPPTVIPETWRFQNFTDAWHAAPFGRYFLNSLFISTTVAVGVVVTSVLAGYVFARMRFPGRGLLFGIFLATMMIPFEATLIPNFFTVRNLHMYDTYAGLIVPWLANVVGIFLMRQFFATLPNELFEAATIDGCGHGRMLWNIALPLARGPMGAVALFNFLAQWNSLFWALIVIGSHQEYFPIQRGLSEFVNADTNDPQLQMAAAALTVLPIVIFYFFLQKQFIEGIASTGLKG